MTLGDEPSAEARRAAFARHMQRILGDQQPLADAAAGTGPLAEMEAMKLQIDADGLMMRGMMGAMPGQASNATLSTLQAAYDAYLRVLNDGPDNSMLIDKKRIRNQMAQTLELMGNACDAMSDSDQALAYYRRSLSALETLGDPAETARMRRKIAQLSEHTSGAIDQTLDRLDETVGGSDGDHVGPFAEIDRLLDLAAATLKGGDSHGALEIAKRAEEALEREKIVDPPAKNLAHDLFATIQGIQSGDMQAGASPIEHAMKARATFASLYSLYVQIYSATEPGHRSFESDMEKADYYQSKWDKMEDKEANADFSSAMLDLLGKLK